MRGRRRRWGFTCFFCVFFALFVERFPRRFVQRFVRDFDTHCFKLSTNGFVDVKSLYGSGGAEGVKASCKASTKGLVLTNNLYTGDLGSTGFAGSTSFAGSTAFVDAT